MAAKKQVTPQPTQHSGIRIDETIPVEEIEKTTILFIFCTFFGSTTNYGAKNVLIFVFEK